MGSPLTSALPLPTAFPANTLTTGKQQRVFGRELVIPDAVRFPGADSRGADAAKAVHPWRHRLQVRRVDARPDPAQVVDLHARGDRPNQQLIGIAVSQQDPARPADLKLTVTGGLA